MKEKLEEAVKKLAEKAAKSVSPIEAQQYAQAVLNLGNTLGVLGFARSDEK